MTLESQKQHLILKSSTYSAGRFSHPQIHPSQKMAQVETVVKQGLELQLCVLECLLLAGYDPQISRSELIELLRLPMILPASFPSKVLWGKKHRNDRSSGSKCRSTVPVLKGYRFPPNKYWTFHFRDRRDPEQICRIAEDGILWGTWATGQLVPQIQQLSVPTGMLPAAVFG